MRVGRSCLRLRRAHRDLALATLRTSRDRLAASLVELGAMAAASNVATSASSSSWPPPAPASGNGTCDRESSPGRTRSSASMGSIRTEEPPSFERYIETIHPDDRERFRRTIDRDRRIARYFSLEFRILWPDGSVHWTHGVGRVFRDADGRPTRADRHRHRHHRSSAGLRPIATGSSPTNAAPGPSVRHSSTSSRTSSGHRSRPSSV